jgi:hypothetical protein
VGKVSFLGGLGTWLVTKRRIAKVAYSLGSDESKLRWKVLVMCCCCRERMWHRVRGAERWGQESGAS